MQLLTYQAALAATILSFVVYTNAFWRMECHFDVGLARIDPLISPGEPSSHMHSVFGSSGFSQTSDYDALMAGSCTSCTVEQDHSAYWTPTLYFQYANGTYTVVDRAGGMLAYYLLYPNPGETSITAFPQNFSMIAGDPSQRNFTLPVPDPPLSEWAGDPAQESQAALAQKALGFNCLNYAITPEGSLYRHFMPDKAYLDANCKDGLRFELMFPSCWDESQGPTSKNFKSHVAYPNLVKTGNCPSGFGTRLPSLFYETIYNTQDFVGVDGQFVLSNGDPTGYGYHGDFMMGWDETLLQNAVDQCTNQSGEMSDCPLFKLQDDSVSGSCQFPIPANLAADNAVSPGNTLPGDVQIQPGPAYATFGGHGPAGGPSSAPVPTLVYSAGPSTNIAGGIFAEASGGYSASSAQTNPPPPQSPTAPAPTPTPAPTTNPLLPGESIVSTTYITMADKNEVMELVMVEQEVTVYVSTTVLATTTISEKRRKHRRHGHAHVHEAS